jgi:hypothetical protein
MTGQRNDWCKDLLRQYDSDLKLLQGMLLNQMQNNRPMQNQNHDDNHQVLIQELRKKKGIVNQLEKENQNLAQEFIKAKQEKKDSKPTIVLQEMVKEKNQVKLLIEGNSHHEIENRGFACIKFIFKK